MQTTVEGTAMTVISTAEILALRALPVARHVYGMLHQFVHALVPRRRNGNDGNAQLMLHLVEEYGAAVAVHFVHHVQCQHPGDVQFQELHCQIEIPLYIGGIDNVDDGVRMFFQHEASADGLFCRIGRKAVDTGKVGDLGIGMSANGSTLAVDGDTGKVPHMLVGPGKLVEECSLAAILVSHKGKP